MFFHASCYDIGRPCQPSPEYIWNPTTSCHITHLPPPGSSHHYLLLRLFQFPPNCFSCFHFVSIIFLNTVAILLLWNLNSILSPRCLRHLHIFLRVETKEVLCGGLQGLTQSLLSLSGFLSNLRNYTSLLCQCNCRRTGFLAQHTLDSGTLHWPFPPGSMFSPRSPPGSLL